MLVAEGRDGQKSIFDRAVVALRLAKIRRDGAERLVRVHVKMGGRGSPLVSPFHRDLAHGGGLEDRAAVLLAERRDPRDFDVVIALGALDPQAVAREVVGDRRRNEIGPRAIHDDRADESRRIRNAHRRGRAFQRARLSREDIHGRFGALQAITNGDAIRRRRAIRHDLANVVGVRGGPFSVSFCRAVAVRTRCRSGR